LATKIFYESDIDSSHTRESHDKRIIETAQACVEFFGRIYDVRLVSIDVYARTIARFKKVPVETLHDDKKEVPEFVYFKEIEIEDESAVYQNMPKPADCSPSTNSFCFKCADGKNIYAIAENGVISLLDEQSDFKGLSVKPINIRQKLLAKALLSPAYDTYVVDAMAGSGKTLLAFACAMRLVDFNRQGDNNYEKIIYCRNSIESTDRGAGVGYLAGNEEKFRIYNMALYDTMEFIARKKLKKHENRENDESIQSKAEELISKYNIQTLWPGEARGRTLSHSIVILDEWQNSSDKTTQLILSRLDDTCKAIIIGSNRQIDNLYLNKYNNGLTSMLKKSQKEKTHLNIFAIDLEKSVRGKFAQFADEEF
jgi:PhoH-like ATPase